MNFKNKLILTMVISGSTFSLIYGLKTNNKDSLFVPKEGFNSKEVSTPEEKNDPSVSNQSDGLKESSDVIENSSIMHVAPELLAESPPSVKPEEEKGGFKSKEETASEESSIIHIVSSSSPEEENSTTKVSSGIHAVSEALAIPTKLAETNHEENSSIILSPSLEEETKSEDIYGVPPGTDFYDTSKFWNSFPEEETALEDSSIISSPSLEDEAEYLFSLELLPDPQGSPEFWKSFEKEETSTSGIQTVPELLAIPTKLAKTNHEENSSIISNPSPKEETSTTKIFSKISRNRS